MPDRKSPASIAPADTGGDVAAFLDQVSRLPPVVRHSGDRGRMIFAMDATMSRQPSWDRALQLQGEMFAETERIGGLDVQLVYFRGFNECRASKWAGSATSLARLMSGVECRGGNTQISKVLAHIRREATAARIGAAVFVGDAMEENIDALCRIAGEIGLLGAPVFMFQEGRDGNVESAFREIARLTRGAYARFDASSAKLLRELLTAAAVYAAGGLSALADHSRSEGAGRLLEQMR
ncbi:hypothetical protein BH10PSE7_BH10PSE7_09820 [soil metagenome]